MSQTPPTSPSEIELALMSSALDADAGSVYRIASKLMDEGVAFDSVLFDYLIPTENSVGQRWAQGDYLVSEEHAITATIETVISLLTGMFDQPTDGRVVVIATAEGDDHSLPARAVGAYLLYRGYRTKFIGANVPASDFSEFLAVEQPEAVVLAAAMTTHLPGAHSMIKAAHENGIPVVAGGRAFGHDGQWATAVGADLWVGTLHDVEPALENWAQNPPSELAEGVVPSGEFLDLAARRERLVSVAESTITTSEVDRLGDEIRNLFDAVLSSILVDDVAITAEMIEWQKTSLEAHGLDSNAVFEAVAGVFEPEFGTAHALLMDAHERAGF